MEAIIGLLLSWQGLLVAAVCYGVTQLIKTVIDNKIGVQKRKANPWVSRVLLPMIPIWVGALVAVAVPLRPEALISYLEEHVHDWTRYLAFAVWGGTIGMLSDYLYSKVKDALQGFRPPTPPAGGAE